MKRWIKTLLIWGLLIGAVFIALLNRNPERSRRSHHRVYVTPDQSLKLIEAGGIDEYLLRDQYIVLTTSEGTRLNVASSDPRILQRLNETGVPYSSDSGDSTSSELSNALLLFVGLIVVFGAIIYFLRKKGGGQWNKIFELRKTKARPVGDTDKAHFADIGGNREAVEMLSDIVDFLQAPDRWKAARARLPRGVLMVGPPGTGKTLLARAVAGETKSAFFYTSATEFVEMFIGVGPARVRDTFEKAAAQQPAVIFIDELDAIGRKRGSGFGTMHEEREQTLNQLLVLLDGLERHDRLVVMAATNRLDVLDPALLRSGRFDRVLRTEPPTLAERLEILKIHTRTKPLDGGVSLEQIAAQTDGFTGADLESLANDAALGAVRRCRGAGNEINPVSITAEDFERSLKSINRSNRQFDRLDSVLVESVSQFAEPTGRAAARITLTTGTVVEGDVVWMNTAHIKLRRTDGSEVVVSKDMAEQIVRLEGTELASSGDFTPDPWAGRNLEAG